MTGFARSICPAPALATALLAALLLPGAAGAQERSRIEVVPQIPHAARVLSAAFSPDGAWVVSGSQGGTVSFGMQQPDDSFALWGAIPTAISSFGSSPSRPTEPVHSQVSIAGG